MEERINDDLIYDRIRFSRIPDKFFNVLICNSDLTVDEEWAEIDKKVETEIELLNMCNSFFRDNIYYYLRYLLGDNILDEYCISYELDYIIFEQEKEYNCSKIEYINDLIMSIKCMPREDSNCLYYDIYNIMYYSAEEVLKRYKREGVKMFIENFKIDESWREYE